MRSTMLQEKYNSLGLINMGKDLNIGMVSVVNDFTKPNGINLILTYYLVNNKYTCIK